MRWIAVFLLGPAGMSGVGCSNEPPAEPSVPPAAEEPVALRAAQPGAPERQVYAKTTANPPAAAATPPAAGRTPPPADQRPAPTPPPDNPDSSQANRDRIPRVLLTKGHADLCRVGVGDPMPALQLANLEGQPRQLAELYGKRLTVVCFWKDDRALARAELADLGPDVAAPYGDRGVAVVGIAVGQSPESVHQRVTDLGVTFPTLVDADESGFGQVGAKKLPRTYLLDAAGKIVWFDIEYSRSTRRELAQAIGAMLGDR